MLSLWLGWMVTRETGDAKKALRPHLAPDRVSGRPAFHADSRASRWSKPVNWTSKIRASPPGTEDACDLGEGRGRVVPVVRPERREHEVNPCALEGKPVSPAIDLVVPLVAAIARIRSDGSTPTSEAAGSSW